MKKFFILIVLLFFPLNFSWSLEKEISELTINLDLQKNEFANMKIIEISKGKEENQLYALNISPRNNDLYASHFNKNPILFWKVFSNKKYEIKVEKDQGLKGRIYGEVISYNLKLEELKTNENIIISESKPSEGFKSLKIWTIIPYNLRERYYSSNLKFLLKIF